MSSCPLSHYSYDALNQLVSATYGGNTYTYSYDNGGNITEVKKNGTVIKSYTYSSGEWKDLLVNYNGEKNADNTLKIYEYDTIGNPLTYRNNLAFTWSNGRQLTGFTQNGNALASYTYNADGLRTSKTANGTTTNYYWANGILQAQKTGDEYIIFLYDENGSAYGIIVKNGTTEAYYYYVFNLQGDVIGIVDSSGATVVEYTYGPWGDILSVTGSMADTIGQKNPLRYRGYYYDNETGFYLTGTRYYDPEIGRFISPDTTDVLTATPMALTDKNLYAYCDNNPVVRADHSGEFWHIVAGATIGGITSFAATLITGGSLDEAFLSLAFGAGAGALTAMFPGVGLLIDAGFSIAEEVTLNLIEKESVPKTTVNTAVSVGVDTVFSLTNEGGCITKETAKSYVSAIARTKKGNHPIVKKAARKTIKTTHKAVAKEVGEVTVTKTVGNFFKNLLKAIF